MAALEQREITVRVRALAIFNLTAIVVLIIQNGDDYYFAEELANALGVTVKAPNDLLYIMPSGRMYVGEARDGKFVDYHPNQRGRKK